MKHIFFDLDGTLLPMDQDLFTKKYFTGLILFHMLYGHNPLKFKDVLKVCIKNMMKNDGSRNNEDAFFEYYEKTLKVSKEKALKRLAKFYAIQFPKIVKNTCGVNPKVKDLIHVLNKKGYKIYILTNPLFPSVATLTRIKQAGIDMDDVTFVTTYENSSFTKPNLKYYEEVINKFSINKDEVMMVGNDVKDDLVIKQLGIPCYLITDELINNENIDIQNELHGSFEEFMEYVNTLPNIR